VPGGQEAAPNPDDAEALRLSRAIAHHEEAAIAEFYGKWFDWSLAFARSFTRRDESFCLDVVQDAMMRVIRCMPVIQSHAGMKAWLRRVVASAALDVLRAEHRRCERERLAVVTRSDAAGTATAPDDAAQRLERIAWITAELAGISTEDHEAVRRRIVGGESVGTLAAASQRTEGSIQGRLTRLLSRLRIRGRELDL